MLPSSPSWFLTKGPLERAHRLLPSSQPTSFASRCRLMWWARPCNAAATRGALRSFNDLTTRLFPALFPTPALERDFFFFFLNSPVKIWMIISTFGFHLLKCNVSSTPQNPPPRPPLQTPERDLALASEPPSAKLQAGKARNTLNRKCSARQKEGSHCGDW